MTKQVQIYIGVSSLIVGGYALSGLAIPFLVVALPGLGLCYGMSRYNDLND